MKTSRHTLYLAAGILALVATSCGKKDADKIGEAQACLDSATAATATACMEKVSGLESTQAYVIRCAATFIAESFDTPTKITSAYNNMNGTGSGASDASSSLTAMSALTFSTTTAADANLAYCNKSASKGLMMLSGIANMATHLKSFASCTTNFDATCLTNATNDSATQAAVGAAAAAAYTSSCAGTQTTNAQFCTQFSTAVTAAGGTSNSSCLGKQLLAQYNNTTATCP